MGLYLQMSLLCRCQQKLPSLGKVLPITTRWRCIHEPIGIYTVFYM